MQLIKGSFLRIVLLLSVAAMVACVQGPSGDENQDKPSDGQSSTETQAPVAAPSEEPATGQIEVTSSPPGARVILISRNENGAGAPESRGTTPITISGLPPGKYTVHLEKEGYRYAQENVEVTAREAAKVSANLRKE